MMKRLVKIFVFVFSFTVMISPIFAVNDKTTLKDLREELVKRQNKVNEINKQKGQIKDKINKAEAEINNLAKIINDSNDKIVEAQEKIEQLKEDIEKKQLEIDNLMSFKQVADKDNVYLEYVFNAKSFTDFIYRASVIDQLTKYNDELIKDMNRLIKENEEAKIALDKKIKESEESSLKLNKTLKSYNVSFNDISEDHEDAAEELTAIKKEVTTYEKLYKQYGCKETDSVLDCMSVPYADGLTRPLVAGTITSEYGMRYHPTKHQNLFHYGIDISVKMNTKVYASAPGIVSSIVRVANPNKAGSSCGGNKVYIKHSINGKEYTTVYMHLHSISVSLNQIVSLSTVVGLSGGGESYDYCTTGPHLHFGVQYAGSYTNPRNYINFPALGKKFTSRWN